MHINLIGAGRLGKNISNFFAHQKTFFLSAICTSSKQSSIEAAQILKFSYAAGSVDELLPADIVCIAVPDDVILMTVHKLAASSSIKPGTLVFHVSGALDSSILAPLSEKGAMICSFHPLKAFHTVEQNAFQDVFCVIEGQIPALTRLKQIFEPSGALFIDIQPEQKGIYHAAAVMASNYLVTLAAAGCQLMEEAGIEQRTARMMIENLMQGSLNNVKKAVVPSEALTGPLMRNDKATIRRHLEALQHNQWLSLYECAGLATLRSVMLKTDAELL